MVFEARALTKELGGRTLYQDVDLAVQQGCTVAICGASGAGKSQLMRQLSGLDPDASPGMRQTGSISFQGRLLADWGPFLWRAEVCSLPQVVPRIEGTPAEFAQRLGGLRVQRVRTSRDYRELGSRLRLGVELWDQPWRDLSVGERQRALIAIMLGRKPGVLLLDEPTASLDAESVKCVEELLREETCLWVTHSSEQAERVADSVFTLKGARDVH